MEGDDAELLGPNSRVSVTGASGSGKTTNVLKILGDKRVKILDRVIWLAPPFSCRQKEITELAQRGHFKGQPNKAFLLIPAGDGWPELVEQALKEGESDPKFHQILVMDDMLQETGHGPAEKLFTAMWISGRHRRCGIWELGHRCFPNQASKIHRTNAEIFILHRMASKDEISTLLRQICPEDCAQLAAAYNKIVAESPYGFLLVDNRFHKNWPELKYRTGDLETVIELTQQAETPKVRRKKVSSREA